VVLRVVEAVAPCCGVLRVNISNSEGKRDDAKEGAEGRRGETHVPGSIGEVESFEGAGVELHVLGEIVGAQGVGGVVGGVGEEGEIGC